MLKISIYLWSSPRWRQEDRISHKVRNNLEEIPNNELYLVLDPVHPGVVAGHVDFVDVDVNGDDPVTGQGELDGVAAHSAKPVHNYPAPHHLGDVSCNFLWGH